MGTYPYANDSPTDGQVFEMSHADSSDDGLALLIALGLWQGGAPPEGGLVRWCEAGLLRGGLSWALDVRADEVFGPLCRLLGGEAAGLRLEDVRDGELTELWVRQGKRRHRFRVKGPLELAERLNRLFARDAGVGASALLGAWESSEQLWVVPKRALGPLLSSSFFHPKNRAFLRRVLGSRAAAPRRR